MMLSPSFVPIERENPITMGSKPSGASVRCYGECRGRSNPTRKSWERPVLPDPEGINESGEYWNGQFACTKDRLSTTFERPE